jgi:hypothetical protein
MDIRRKATTHGQPVRAGLLLRERPLRRIPLLDRRELGEELRPLHPGLDFDESPLAIECEYAIELANVDQHAIGSECLGTHCMTSAGDAHCPSLASRRAKRVTHRIECLRFNDAMDACRIELRVDVVDDEPRRLRRGSGTRPNRRETCNA